MKYFFYILFLFCTWGISTASNKQTDSLRYIIDNKKGYEKLTAIQKALSSSYRLESLPHIEEFADEAKTQSDPLFLAIAYEYKSDYFRIESQLDSMRIYAEKSLDELDKVSKKNIKSEENKELYRSTFFNSNQLLIKYYFRNGQYYMARNIVELMLERSKKEGNVTSEADAYYLMFLIYTVLDNFELAAQHLKKSIKLDNEGTDRKIRNYLAAQEVYRALYHYDKSLDSFDKVLEITDTLERYIEKGYLADEFDIITVYQTAAYTYIQSGDLPTAKDYIDKAVEVNFLDIDSASIHVLNAEYYIAVNDNTKALQEINIALANGSNHPISNILSNQDLKAMILRKLGKNAEAYDLLKEVSEGRLAVKQSLTADRIVELETLHRVDKLKDDLLLKDSKLHSFRLLLGGSILILLLVIVVVVVILRGNKKLKERNLDLYKRHKKLEEKNKEIETIKRQTDLEDADDIIMNKLDCYMEESKVFLDSDVTRDSLAIQIGTNRQYLVAAIKEKRSQTFNEYIYMWRLRYAYNLIISNRDVPISEIFLESGFSSQSVFNREFKKLYGMTPSELRTAAEEEEKNAKV